MFPEDFAPMLELEQGLDEREYRKVFVGFGLFPIQDEEKSREAGFPVFREVEHVGIQFPGDKTTFFFQPVEPNNREYRQKFPMAYRRFKDGEKTPIDGLPIDKWAPVTRGEAMTFKALGIRTVEALAELNDTNLEPLGQRGRDLRKMAMTTIAQAKDAASAHKVAAEKDALEKRFELLAKQNEALAAQIAELTDKRKPKAAA